MTTQNIESLIADLQTDSIDETVFINSILQYLSSENIDQNKVLTQLDDLKENQTLSILMHQQIINRIKDSNAETVLAKTIVAPVSATKNKSSDKTELAYDQTFLDTASTHDQKTLLANPNSDNVTQVRNSSLDITQIANIDADKTLLADTAVQISNANTLTDDLTQVANQQTLREQTQQISAAEFDSETKKLATGAILKDRFILKNVIGSGGMSVVFRALDLRKQEAKNHNPYVAIKVLGDSFKHHPLSLLALERETQKIQSLAHPNIITVYDFDRDGDNIYMTMECLEGQSLDVVIRQHDEGMPFTEAYDIIEGMSQALIYAHSKDIIHSDFKPENVYYTDKKTTKVLDFGIARAKKLPGVKPVDTVFDAGSLSALTPPYASLEMLKDKDPDPRDDIYALACVSYKLLTGKHPYNNLQADIAQKAEMKPVKIPGLDRRQWQTMLSALAFERSKRIATVDMFIEGIKPKKRGWIYALVATVVLAIAASGYLGISITEQDAIPKIKLTQDQEKKIKNYLEIAELYFTLGYLATPPGDSALDQYVKVLEIDPSNKVAIEGKKKLVQRYQELSMEKQNLQAFEESLQLLETALLIDPDNEDVLNSLNEVKNLRN